MLTISLFELCLSFIKRPTDYNRENKENVSDNSLFVLPSLLKIPETFSLWTCWQELIVIEDKSTEFSEIGNVGTLESIGIGSSWCKIAWFFRSIYFALKVKQPFRIVFFVCTAYHIYARCRVWVLAYAINIEKC